MVDKVETADEVEGGGWGWLGDTDSPPYESVEVTEFFPLRGMWCMCLPTKTGDPAP